MLNCTATCRGADKKPRDNKLVKPMVADNLSDRFGGIDAMNNSALDTINETVDSFNRTLALVEGAFDNPAVRSAERILETVNRVNNIGLGELSLL